MLATHAGSSTSSPRRRSGQCAGGVGRTRFMDEGPMRRSRQFTLSATTFVLPSGACTAHHVRIVTPTYERAVRRHRTSDRARRSFDEGSGDTVIVDMRVRGHHVTVSDERRWSGTLQAIRRHHRIRYIRQSRPTGGDDWFSRNPCIFCRVTDLYAATALWVDKGRTA